jgi:hypothetical protein
MYNVFIRFLVRSSFIITIVIIIKRYKGRTIVFALVSSVCHSVPIEGLIQTWSFYQDHENGGANFVQRTIKLKTKRLVFWGIFFPFSHTNEL